MAIVICGEFTKNVSIIKYAKKSEEGVKNGPDIVCRNMIGNKESKAERFRELALMLWNSAWRHDLT